MNNTKLANGTAYNHERLPDLFLRTLKEAFEAYDKNYKELEGRLNEAKKVIKYYANEKNWEKKQTEMGEFSMMCFDDRGGTARDLLEKWGEE